MREYGACCRWPQQVAIQQDANESKAGSLQCRNSPGFQHIWTPQTARSLVMTFIHHMPGHWFAGTDSEAAYAST